MSSDEQPPGGAAYPPGALLPLPEVEGPGSGRALSLQDVEAGLDLPPPGLAAGGPGAGAAWGVAQPMGEGLPLQASTGAGFPPPAALAPEAGSPWAGGAPAPAPPPVAPPPARPASRTFLVVVSVLALTADLGSKIWAKARLAGVEEHKHTPKKLELLKDHVDFIFAQNPGGAWSFLRSLPDSLRRPFFLVVSAAAIVFIVTVYGRVKNDQLAMKWGLPLALGGALGNLADRIRFGWVVDFVDVWVNQGGHEHHWPTFNVADIAIVVGVGLMAFDMLRSSRRHRPPAPRPPPPGPLPLPAPGPAPLPVGLAPEAPAPLGLAPEAAAPLGLAPEAAAPPLGLAPQGPPPAHVPPG